MQGTLPNPGRLRVSEGWAYGGAPLTASAPGVVTIVQGVSFCLSDRRGDIAEGGGQGLFYRDTPFVSRLELAVDGQRLQPLSVRSPAPYATTFIGQRPPRPGTADSTLLVLRARYVGTGMLERITVRNLGRSRRASR